jgi:hypothetical protein
MSNQLEERGNTEEKQKRKVTKLQRDENKGNREKNKTGTVSEKINVNLSREGGQ